MGKKKSAIVNISKAAGPPATKAPKINPFEQKITKTKFDILNKKTIGVKGKPLQARAKSVNLRQKTIVPELKKRGRSGEFKDNRFGEYNREMSGEEKMMERYSKERLRISKKKAVFNIQGEADYNEESNLTLTHKGQKVDDLEDFDSDPNDSAYDSDLEFDNNDNEGNFGGDGVGRERSREEVMSEIILKSKHHKMERQKLKEENAALLSALDQQYSQIAANLQRNEPEDLIEKAKAANKLDDYNEMLKTMIFEKKAQPSDRKRTAEEIAVASKQKEEREARERAKRMEGDLEPDIDGEEGSEDEEDHLTEAEKSKLRVIEKCRELIQVIMTSQDKDAINEKYVQIVEIAKTRSVVQLGKSLQDIMKDMADQFVALAENKSYPHMPTIGILLLFKLIGNVFSTSDKKHTIVTPAVLIMSHFLQVGRMLSKKHLISALYLMQLLLHYFRDSKRYSPDMMALLMFFIRKAFNVTFKCWVPYPSHRLLSKPLSDFITSPLTNDSFEPQEVTFEDHVNSWKDEEYFTKEMFCGALINLLTKSVELYKDNLASPEIFLPLLQLGSTSSPHIQNIFANLASQIKELHSTRPPLDLLKQKAKAIPQFDPDLRDEGGKAEKEEKMLKKAYKKEFRGAKRELRRDSEFLARHKLEEKLEADRKYQERIRQVMGTIANDSASKKSRTRR